MVIVEQIAGFAGLVRPTILWAAVGCVEQRGNGRDDLSRRERLCNENAVRHAV